MDICFRTVRYFKVHSKFYYRCREYTSDSFRREYARALPVCRPTSPEAEGARNLEFQRRASVCSCGRFQPDWLGRPVFLVAAKASFAARGRLVSINTPPNLRVTRYSADYANDAISERDNVIAARGTQI